MTALAEIITVERRRRWPLADKARLVAETMMPGASVSAVARRYGLHPSQLFAWRKLARDGGLMNQAGSVEAMFTPVVVGTASTPLPSTETIPERPATSASPSGRMEIELKGGRRIAVFADVDAAALARVLAVLERA